jgi:hypothetical protein
MRDTTRRRRLLIEAEYKKLLDELCMMRGDSPLGRSPSLRCSNHKVAELISKRTGYVYSASFVYDLLFTKRRRIA